MELDKALKAVASIEVECVAKNVFMRVHLGPGTNPAEVGDILRAFDPEVKVRDSFPAKGNFGGGGREDKVAAVCSITCGKRADGQLSVDLSCQDAAGEDIAVAMGSKHTPGFLDDLKSKWSGDKTKLEKFMAGVESGKKCVLRVHDADKLGVKYWSSEDGKHWAQGLTTEVPAAKAAE